MTRDSQGKFVRKYQDATQVDPSMERPKLEPCREYGCPRRTKLAQGYCHVHRAQAMRALFAEPQQPEPRDFSYLDKPEPIDPKVVRIRLAALGLIGFIIMASMWFALREGC